MKSRLPILLFLARVPGFQDLMFEELEAFLEILEVRRFSAAAGIGDLTGHSIVYAGTVRLPDGQEVGLHELLAHSGKEEDETFRAIALLPTILLNFSDSGMEMLLRKEPEVAMFLLERLKSRELGRASNQ